MRPRPTRPMPARPTPAPTTKTPKRTRNSPPVKREDVILLSGGAQGAEAELGAAAERFGIEEVNFTFEGHKPSRTRGLRVLNHEELYTGDVSLAYISRLMNR